MSLLDHHPYMHATSMQLVVCSVCYLLESKALLKVACFLVSICFSFPGAP
jgi:hypothetical protein